MFHHPQHLMPAFFSKPDLCLAHLGNPGWPKCHWSSCGKMGSRAGLEPTPEQGRLSSGMITEPAKWNHSSQEPSLGSFRADITSFQASSNRPEQHQAAKWAAIKQQRMESSLGVQSQTGTANITSLVPKLQQGAPRATPQLETLMVRQGICSITVQEAKERERNAGPGLWGHFTHLRTSKHEKKQSLPCWLPECRLCRDFISRRIINRLGILRRGKMQLMSISHPVGETSG